MTATLFKPATRRKTRLRMALDGPAGSGKTYTALRFAHALGARIAVIDTEAGSASKYIGESPDGQPWRFDVCELRDFAPTAYTDAIQAAGQAGYDVLVIDSLTHAWQGPGGALEIVDRKGGSKFTAWKDVTPMHNRMVDAILRSPCHVIVTMRSKMEYVLEADEKGKQVPRKVGMGPIQRQGMEYEFDLVCDLDWTHTLTVGKSRCSAVADAISVKPGPAFMAPVAHWLAEGADVPQALIDAAALDFRDPAAVAAASNGHAQPAEEVDIKERMRQAATKRKAAQQRPTEQTTNSAEGPARDAPSRPSIHSETPAPAPAVEATPEKPPFDVTPAADLIPPADPDSPSTKEQRERIKGYFDRLAIPDADQLAMCQRRGVSSFRSFTWRQADELLQKLIALDLGLPVPTFASDAAEAGAKN